MFIDKVTIGFKIKLVARYNSAFEKCTFISVELIKDICKECFDVELEYNIWTDTFTFDINFIDEAKSFNMYGYDIHTPVEKFVNDINEWMDRVDEYLANKYKYEHDWEDEGDDYDYLRPFKDCADIDDGIKLVSENPEVVKRCVESFIKKPTKEV